MISDAMNINGQRYVLREDYDVLAAWCEALRGALADIAFSSDMTLAVAKSKAKRVYEETTSVADGAEQK